MSNTPKQHPAFITLNNIRKSFREGDQDRLVLDQLDITFAEGEFVIVLGPSGSGKSTLLNLISGIDDPTTGTIHIDDVDVTALNDKARTLHRRDNVGFIFQFFNLIPTLTVLENVTLPSELAGRSDAAVQKRALELLDRVGLADRRDAFPDKLSGGEQQRVAIARALAHDPRLVLADEPTGNLDEATGDLVMQLLLDLTRSNGKTLIMVTHSPDLVALADRILMMTDHRLVERFKTADGSLADA